MSMVATIKLAQPLPCLQCGSIDGLLVVEKLDSNYIPPNNHGLRDLTTKDIDPWIGNSYYFPGFVQKEDFISWGGKEDRCIDAGSWCRANQVVAKTKLYFEYDGKEEIFVTNHLETVSSDGKFAAKIPEGRQQTEFYDFIVFPDAQVRVVPRFEAWIKHYTARTHEMQTKAAGYRKILDGIREPEVPTDRIVSILEEKLAGLDYPLKFHHGLAEATRQYGRAERGLRWTESAFGAALVYLYHQKPKDALKLAKASRFANRKQFLKELIYHAWVHLEDAPSSPAKLKHFLDLMSSSVYGLWGGTNEFLDTIHREQPPTKWDTAFSHMERAGLSKILEQLDSGQGDEIFNQFFAKQK